jgi:hypothetical protein
MYNDDLLKHDWWIIVQIECRRVPLNEPVYQVKAAELDGDPGNRALSSRLVRDIVWWPCQVCLHSSRGEIPVQGRSLPCMVHSWLVCLFLGMNENSLTWLPQIIREVES